jgi:hypothetical protein
VADQEVYEYRVYTVGSALKGQKDEDISAALTKLSLEGWEIFSIKFPYGSRPKIITRRTLSEAERRQRSWPG